jgi:ubiquinone/menaquinone biosynthesis C-methylase UbiE
LLSEGFTQSHPFVLKREQEIYDEFYVEVYDGLTETDKRSRACLTKMVDMAEPTVNNSVFLDIGSGTGYMVNELKEIGFKAYGIDKSQAMIDYSEKVYPGIKTKKGDVMDSMFFDKGIFTHVLCSYFTIYQIQDKQMFFRNCYFWMKPNGYLILHLVDREKFDPIVPIGKATIINSPQKYGGKRITDTVVEFDAFQYKATYQFDNSRKSAVFKETFTDKQSANVRQNEQTLYMEDIKDILEYAVKAGFILHSKADMLEEVGDKYQYLYVLERGKP